MLTSEAMAIRRELLAHVRYRVEFDLTSRDDGARTRTEIAFGCREPGARTFADLDVTSAQKIVLNGVELDRDAWGDGRLQLPPLEADNVLVVEADVDFSNDRHGLCAFIDGEERFIYTKGGPNAASRFMCCFMGAGPASYELRASAPLGWSVVSHARPTEEVRQGAHCEWSFPSQTLTSPHALTFAAGPLVTAAQGSSASGGRTVRLHCRPSAEGALRSTRLADLYDAAIRAHERVLGVPYSFGQCDLLFIPGYGGQAGATPGLVVAHERVLHASLDPDWRRYVLWVIAHETAHFWFGHLVHGRDPEDLWLMEGTATYLCHRLIEELAPELNPWATFHILEATAAHDADSSDRTHAITKPPSGIRSHTPGLAYEKPAAVLHQLEGITGRARLDDALTMFLQQYPFMDATSADFVRCLEDAADVDLNGWADDWLHSEGVNTLEMEMTATDGRLSACRIIQSPAGGRLRTHRITVSVYDKTTRGLIRRDPIPVSISGASTPLPELLGHPRPDVLVLNAPATGYVKVRLDPRTRETVANCLGELDAETRAVCWVAGWEMVKDGIMPAEELAHWVVEHVGKERDPQVRELLHATCHPPLPAWYAGSLQAPTSSKD